MSQRYSAFSNDCLGTLDATGVTELIRRGEISLPEAVDAAIARAEKAQGILHAIAVSDFERARGEASHGELAKDRLLNVPAFLKDNIDLNGLPTRFGSSATSPLPVRRTEPLAEQLRASGLHFIGKSTTPAFGFGCSTEFDDGTPPTKNPWNLSLSAGGSSGGSAALVAAGVVPIAHGNDGGGSIRIPASLCGLVGLKPSRGRLVRQVKAKAMPVDIISDGVLTRSVRDTAHFFYEAEHYYKPGALKPIGLVRNPSKRRLRVGLTLDSILTKPCVETSAVIESVGKTLSELGHSVEVAAFAAEERFARDFTLYWSFLAVSVERFGKRIFSPDFDRENLDGLTRGLSRNFKKNRIDTVKAIFYLRNIHKTPTFREWNYDVVLSPVLARVPPELGYLNPGVPFEELLRRLQDYVGYTPLANVLGNPAISLPMGMSQAGAPIGVQISAPTGEEARLLELAFELEDARPWPILGTMV